MKELVILEYEIAKLNMAFHEYVAPHAELLGSYFDADGEALREVRDACMYSIGERLPVPPPLVPTALTKRLKGLHQAFRSGLNHVYENRMDASWERLADELRLDGPSNRYIRASRRPRWAHIGRPDVVIHGDVVTMVEPNVGTSCGGMPDADLLARIFMEAPVIGDFLRGIGATPGDAIGPIASLIRAEMKSQATEPDGLVVVIERQEELANPGFYHCTMLARELRRHGIKAEAAAVEDLEVAEDAVTFQRQKVAVVYRMCGEQPDPVGLYPKLAPLIDSAADGNVSLLDDLGDQIAGNKTILAVLSEEVDAGRVPEPTATLLRSFIPWSRILSDTKSLIDGSSVDLLAWCEAQQQDLVLKPGTGFQGRGVTIGCEVEPAQWREVIESAISSSEAWLVQRLVRTKPTRIAISRSGTLTHEENFVDYGYYVAGDAIGIAGIRKSAPFGKMTRKVKPPVFAPLFFVQ
ncbi:hypothetical protein [Streptomyces sp. NBC_01794]|uniref:hypothetical protein n=1 Tax=Streptomyces sp. NBC_01794 TaxID=2975942 RepID=UPI00309151A4|nr:hypothetical protein OIE54_00425 [Streptomyces sp. NBC_01794]WSB05149.1 hypothetical protein OIE54_41720 [Streptomyces sp. NBC_01794]